jgi:hypothetical protein
MQQFDHATTSLQLKGRDIPSGAFWSRLGYSHRAATPSPQSASPDASPAIPPRVPCFEASRRARIPSLPAESLVLVLWLNQVTRRFCGELPQTPRADSGCELHPAPTYVHDFVLLFLSPWGPHLIPFGHRVPRAKPTCLSTPRSPRKTKTFRARSSLAPTQTKPQLALAILDQELVHTTLSITHH